ncbi:hypothetical protein [Corynebacterium pseudokroppenstedtii]|uniref:hypothetical protein n=1 Tax=Corynebacterium pseudokroppenstedtii TaxID=2804917 RepID=UPI00307AF334
MHWKKKLALSLAASMSLVSIPAVSASASPTSQEQGCVAAHQGISTSTAERQTVSKDELAQLNKNIELVGENPLPEGTVEYGFTDNGDAVAIDDSGQKTILLSATDMNSELDRGTFQYKAESEENDDDDDKGVLSGLAASIAGCLGGVVGYDQIVDILKKRVSYWTLGKFLGEKVGPGLAISCIAGAGGALATYMGW